MSCINKENQRNETIKQLFRLKFMFQTLLQLKPNRIKYNDERESVENMLKVLRVKVNSNVNENDNNLLNLGEYCNKVTLSYTAQKATREELFKDLRNRLLPIVNYIEKVRSDSPQIFENVADSLGNKIDSSCLMLLNLETQRRECMQKLGELNNQKIKLIKAALEFKLGPHVCNKLETLYAEMRLLRTKSDLMKKFLINDFVKQSEYSVRAIKSAEGFIDKRFNEENEEEKEETEKI